MYTIYNIKCVSVKNSLNWLVFNIVYLFNSCEIMRKYDNVLWFMSQNIWDMVPRNRDNIILAKHIDN